MQLPFSLTGIVKKFSGHGRQFGYPTANIEVDMDAPEGVFAGFAHLEGKQLPALIFIGVPETVGDTLKRAEAHILDFADRDLYGSKIRMEVVQKLRNNRKFENISELIEAMRQDEKKGRTFFEEKS